MCKKGLTPQGTNIDTNNCYVQRELPLPSHHFGIHSLVFGGVYDIYSYIISTGLPPCPGPKVCRFIRASSAGQGGQNG